MRIVPAPLALAAALTVADAVSDRPFYGSRPSHRALKPEK